MPMRIPSSKSAKRGVASVLAIAMVAVAMGPIYGQDQDEPESLLPPGFGDPTPVPAPSSPAPAPAPAPAAAPAPAPSPAGPAQTPSPTGSTSQPAPPPTLPDASSEVTEADIIRDQDEVMQDALVTQDLAPSSLPARARRNLGQVGLIGTDEGGFDSSALSNVRGPYITSLLANIDKPIVSRWGHILLRRVLVSDLKSPSGANDTDWIAARTRLLLNMGEASLARHLAQQVDAGRYQGRLYNVARDAALASADLTGFCPIANGGAAQSDESNWQLVLAICAAMSGNQSSARAQIDRASRNAVADEIDVLLAQKVVGAGANSRRAVTVNWDGVDRLTLWRFGLATATGAEPPEALYNDTDRRFKAWRAENPAVPLESRMRSADIAAAMGVLSNAALVDLYSITFDETNMTSAVRGRTVLLREAYRQRAAADRMAALQQLWDDAGDSLERYGSQVLTARAAARFPVMNNYADSADGLVAAMLSAGLDRNAVRWRSLVSQGSLAWGLIAVGQPSTGEQISETAMRSFADSDSSESYRKTAFLIAGLAGLGRTDTDAAEDLVAEYGYVLNKQSRWEKALNDAADTNNAALTVLTAAVGMQAQDWSGMSPAHLFHIVRALDKVGLEAEARMIAAEAVTRA
ncbi:hypothetical protein [Alterisphingorhabdus coralli]|uniref:Uncharacterized protein n=1 Tax=Alterisphingorhabdus coralli TaxID=3071408 RepID=A0AA97F634_9SPHN|nr:hypothetical protein [Parasphingorhabdus sp. SCSIO 66989]WOE74136.1 hypothetical protein RB602_09745 [Parasphingorhabdus sp. SCSIO 66989]